MRGRLLLIPFTVFVCFRKVKSGRMRFAERVVRVR
jgi:hypothetical protein